MELTIITRLDGEQKEAYDEKIYGKEKEEATKARKENIRLKLDSNKLVWRHRSERNEGNEIMLGMDDYQSKVMLNYVKK
jgi:hypothetical protein